MRKGGKKAAAAELLHGAKWTPVAALRLLDPLEALPSAAALAAAKSLVVLGDLAPPVCFRGRELVHGRALLAVAPADGGLPAVDLEHVPAAARGALAAAWSALARALAHPRGAGAIMDELEASATASARAYLDGLARSGDPFVRSALTPRAGRGPGGGRSFRRQF